jgi:8-oxo-dGTP pyrophosphatase MutT (NUDIX family)
MEKKIRTRISTSYGIVTYTYTNHDIRFLMTLRRDTFCYESIIRGMYPSLERLQEYIQSITFEEKERMLSYEFDMLWKDLWVSTKRRLYRIEYQSARDRYEKNLTFIMECLHALVDYKKVTWEFPKGKMYSEETSMECALREFQEETNVSKSSIKIVKNAGLFEEMFTGSDGQMYQSKYYLGFIKNGEEIPFRYNKCPYNMRNDYVSDEVMSIAWLTYEEAEEKCTDTKKKVMEDIYLYLFNREHTV